MLLVSPVPSAKAEVDEVQNMDLAANTKHEVLRLDVSVNEAEGMEKLQTPKDLIDDQHARLRREFLAALLHSVL